MTLRLVVLVSGAGTNLQALLDAGADPGYGAEVVAVGADRDGIEALDRARRAGVPAFVLRLADFPTRQDWDAAMYAQVSAHKPDLVVLAGFMKILGPGFMAHVEHRCVNTHAALLPAFPGAHPVRDALAHGARVTGATVHVVDGGVDSGPILAQTAVPVVDGDDERSLHERIKTAERALLVDTIGRMAAGGWSVHGRVVRIGPAGTAG